MKRIFSIALVLGLLGLLSLSSCIDDPIIQEFENFTLSQTNYGIYSNSKGLFVFDAAEHQLATNRQQRLFRIQTDDMATYVQMTLNAEPVVGQICTLRLNCKGLSGLSKNYSVKVLKTDTSKGLVWLSEGSSLTSFIMFYEF